MTRVTPEMADKIDVWRASQRPIPSRSEAPRQPAEIGFTAEPQREIVRDQKKSKR